MAGSDNQRIDAPAHWAQTRARGAGVRDLGDPIEMTDDAKPFPLIMANEDARVRVVQLAGGRTLTQRLTELGLNVGTELRVVQRQGGGLLVARGDIRFAVGGGMAAKILVVPAD